MNQVNSETPKSTVKHGAKGKGVAQLYTSGQLVGHTSLRKREQGDSLICVVFFQRRVDRLRSATCVPELIFVQENRSVQVVSFSPSPFPRFI
jgi:hypothetical protein